MTGPVELGDIGVTADAGTSDTTDPGPGPDLDVETSADPIEMTAALDEPATTVEPDDVLSAGSLATELGEPQAGGGELTVALDEIAELSIGLGEPERIRIRRILQFPTAARALAGLLVQAGLIDADRIGSETPTDLQQALPFIRVFRVAGGSDLVNDYAQIDLDVFAATSVAGEQLAENIRQYLSLPAPPYLGGALIDRIECLTAAAERPWADVRIRRYGATYRVVSRRQPALTA